AQRRGEPLAEDLPGGLLAQVYQLDGGQWAAHDPLRQLGDLVLAPGGPVERLHVRRRAAEDERATRGGGAAAGDGAGMVARGGLALLVGAVVLLVDDDQAGLREGREEGAARADHHVRLPAAEALPLVVAFAIGESAVQDRDPLAQSRAD